MRTKTNFFKIGLFVIAATIIAIIGIVVLGAGALFREEVIVETYFDDSVQGLDVGSPVKYRGVQIGRINSISLASSVYYRPGQKNGSIASKYIVVQIAVFPQSYNLGGDLDFIEALKGEVRQGLRVRLMPQGVTGTAFLEADYLDARRNPPLPFDWEPENPYIPSAPSTITRFSEALQRIMNNLEAINILGISTGIENTLNAIQDTLHQANLTGIGQESEMLLAELRQTNKSLQNMMDTHLAPALASLKTMARNSEQPVASALDSVQKTSAEIKALVGDLKAFTGGLPDTMIQLRATLRRLDEMVVSQQEDMSKAVENMRMISDNLKELTESSKRNPSQLLFGQPPASSNPGVNHD